MDKFSSELCTSKGHVEELSLFCLKIVRPLLQGRSRARSWIHHVENEIQFQIEPDCTVSSDVVEDQILPGHNIAIPTDLNDEPFWLILVNKSAHVVEAKFLDHYGNTWRA
jgi:hypothetical protein